MSEPEEKVNPLPERQMSWVEYNARIEALRLEFASRQAELRATLDEDIRKAHERYQAELSKLRAWLNDEIAKARREVAASAGA